MKDAIVGLLSGLCLLIVFVALFSDDIVEIIRAWKGK